MKWGSLKREIRWNTHQQTQAGRAKRQDRICEGEDRGGKSKAWIITWRVYLRGWTHGAVVTRTAEVSRLIKHTALLGLLAPLWDSPWGFCPLLWNLVKLFMNSWWKESELPLAPFISFSRTLSISDSESSSHVSSFQVMTKHDSPHRSPAFTFSPRARKTEINLFN